LRTDWPGVFRAKGFFWIASRPTVMGTWSLAGGVGSVRFDHWWWAALPALQWPQDPATTAVIRGHWQEPWGDRRQEIVIIGIGMDQAALTSQLDSCLLTEAEMALGVEAWQAFADPLPPANVALPVAP
jgi:G3E family GTPase